MSTATTRPDPAWRGIAFGLIALGSFIALCAIVTIAVVGTMVATGALRHTNQGWVYSGRVSAGEVRSATLDSTHDSLLLSKGSGSSETAQLTANGPWIADWAYACPSDSDSFHLVAKGANQSYPVGTVDRVRSGVGNSNRLPAGTYAFTVTTGPGCTWTVGARPTH